MIQLAGSYQQGFVPLRNISETQQISGKYLSRLVIQLRRHRLLKTERGMNGGYALARSPSEITARMVVEAFERCEHLLPCARRAEACKRHVGCPSRPLWLLLGKTITDTLDAVTLADLAANKGDLEAKIRKTT